MIEEAKVAPLDMDNFIDGVITTQAPGTPGVVTFVTSSPFQCVNFGSGFEIRFAGHQFSHSHPDVIAVLRRLSKRGVGIQEVAATELQEAAQAAAKNSDAEIKQGAAVDLQAAAKAGGAAIQQNQAAGKA